MSENRVVDTGVLVGVCIEIDQHHELCFDYVVEADGTVYVTPTVRSEFEDVEPKIREELHREIAQHRQDVIREMSEGKLSRDAIGYIREQLLERKSRAYRFLYEYYSDLESSRVQVDRLEIELDLEDMEAEVWEDASEEGGGIRALTEHWTREIGSYPDVETELLVNEGPDRDICLEAHHVATEFSDIDTELGTTNPRHFINQVEGEPETRLDNICRCTNLSTVVDLSMSKQP